MASTNFLKFCKNFHRLQSGPCTLNHHRLKVLILQFFRVQKARLYLHYSFVFPSDLVISNPSSLIFPMKFIGDSI